MVAKMYQIYNVCKIAHENFESKCGGGGVHCRGFS